MAKKKKDRIQEVYADCIEQLDEAFSCGVEYLEVEYYQREDQYRKLSPIELLFAYKFVCKYEMCSEWLPITWETGLLGTQIRAVFSPKIYGKSGKFYYPDFIFEVRIGSKVVHDNLKMLIELDGHLWHEKNPDQVEKDKQRERDLQDNGYTLYRFSGREIYRDPELVVDNCVNAYVERIKNGKA